MTPAEHAATVREALTTMGMSHAQRDALVALDALQAQAEQDAKTIAHYTRALDKAEAERDKAVHDRDRWAGEVEPMRAERDRLQREAQRTRDGWAEAENALRARVEELEAALREAEGWLTQGQGSPECHYALGIIRAALDKDTA